MYIVHILPLLFIYTGWPYSNLCYKNIWTFFSYFLYLCVIYDVNVTLYWHVQEKVTETRKL